MQEMWQELWKAPLDKEMAIPSSILAWEIPWTEESCTLQSMGLQRVRRDLMKEHATRSTRMRGKKPKLLTDFILLLLSCTLCFVSSKALQGLRLMTYCHFSKNFIQIFPSIFAARCFREAMGNTKLQLVAILNSILPEHSVH